MNNIISLTFDDFSEYHNDLQYIQLLKKQFPGFCATMFTIPTRCSPQFLKFINKNFPYLELAQHDYNHDEDFFNADYNKAKELIQIGYRKEFIKIFKAQQWYINDEIQQALKDLDYAIALNNFIGQKPIKGIKYHYSNTSHDANWENYKEKDIISCGHMSNYLPNSIRNCIHNLLNLPKDREFRWASECLLEN